MIDKKNHYIVNPFTTFNIQDKENMITKYFPHNEVIFLLAATYLQIVVPNSMMKKKHYIVFPFADN